MKEMFGYSIAEDGKVFGKRGDLLTPWDNGRGYLILGLMMEGVRKTIAVHRLVALAYVDNPENLHEVNHKDGNKVNNHYSNLEWCTRGENIAHAYTSDLRSATGVNNSRCLTDEFTVRKICELIASGHQSAAIRDLGFDYGLVRSIKAMKNWRHISCEYF